MITLRKSSKNPLDTEKVSNQVRKSLRVLFPDSNSAGDFDVILCKTGLLIAPRIGSSVAITSDFYYKILSVLEVALWPTFQLQHPLAMQLQGLQDRDWNRSRAFFYPFLIGSSQRLITTEIEEINYAKRTDNFKLMSNISIPLNKHLIICGQTGSGKSYLLRQFLSVFNSIGSVVLIDPKVSDCARWAKNHPSVELIQPVLSAGANGSSVNSDLLDNVNDKLDSLETIMYKRQESLLQQKKISADYRSLNMKPIFVVIDEVSSLTIGAGRQAKSDFWDHLTRLALLAREAGIVLVLALQQARSDVLPTTVRAQMNVKILLGAIDKDNSQYLFPNLSEVPFLPISGHGTGIMSVAGSQRYWGILPLATPTLKEGITNG